MTVNLSDPATYARQVGTKTYVTPRELSALQTIWRDETHNPLGKPIDSTAHILVQELAKKHNLPDLPDYFYGFDPNTGEFLAPPNWEHIAGDQSS